jgi:hypothetical protein
MTQLQVIEADLGWLESEASKVQVELGVLASPWRETAAGDGRKYYYNKDVSTGVCLLVGVARARVASSHTHLTPRTDAGDKLDAAAWHRGGWCKV